MTLTRSDLLPTTYISLRLPLPPGVAADAFDALVDRLIARSWMTPRRVVEN